MCHYIHPIIIIYSASRWKYTTLLCLQSLLNGTNINIPPFQNVIPLSLDSILMVPILKDQNLAFVNGTILSPYDFH